MSRLEQPVSPGMSHSGLKSADALGHPVGFAHHDEAVGGRIHESDRRDQAPICEVGLDAVGVGGESLPELRGELPRAVGRECDRAHELEQRRLVDVVEPGRDGRRRACGRRPVGASDVLELGELGPALPGHGDAVARTVEPAG